jgi:hypothetical protein
MPIRLVTPTFVALAGAVSLAGCLVLAAGSSRPERRQAITLGS